jgi:hypothetical protein
MAQRGRRKRGRRAAQPSPGTRRRVVELRPSGAVSAPVEVCSTRAGCQVCDLTYRDFRSGWTYKDAYEHLAWGRESQWSPGRRAVLRHMAKLKRDEWEQHQTACATDPGEDFTVDPAEFLDGFGRVHDSRAPLVVVLGALVVLGLTAWAVR